MGVESEVLIAKMIDLSVSIVLFHNDKEEVKRAIHSVLNADLRIKVFLVDNSATDDLRSLSNLDDRICYVFNDENIGFGSAHNLAIKEAIKGNVPYHLVLNPDVYFEKGVLEELFDFMQENPDVGIVMPKVLYPDGKIQYVCRLLPTPTDLFGRRFLGFPPFKGYVEERNHVYELRFTGYDRIMRVPHLVGCFLFIRVDVLKKVGLFDERFFMYLEDTDLTRRICRVADILYYPNVSIFHVYNRDSYKDFGSLRIHMESAIKYFNKWGWFNDPERDTINKKTLKELGYSKAL